MSKPFGPSYEEAKDGARLHSQMDQIREIMLSASECGNWHTLGEIERLTGFPQASVSAQLRHLKKQEFGAYILEKRPRGQRYRGLWEYRLLRPARRCEQLDLLSFRRSA